MEHRAKAVAGETFAEVIFCVTKGPTSHQQKESGDVVTQEGPVEEPYISWDRVLDIYRKPARGLEKGKPAAIL